MNEEQIRQVVERLLAEGKDKAVIMEVVNRLRAQQPAQEQPQEAQPQEAGVFPTEPSQDAAVPPQETQEPYQPDYAEIKRKNEAGEPLTPEEHNAQQEVFAKAVSAAPGFLPMPEWMVPAVSAFGEGVAGLASGTVKGLKSIALYAKEKFDPEFAARVAEDPEVRREYLSNLTRVDEKIDEFAGDLSVGTKQFDSNSITELAASGELLQAGELAAQQTMGALPSVLATMTGWGGMATLGVSAAGSSFDEDLERHPDESIDKLVGAAWAKGGVELASEMVTRGIAKRAGLLMGKGQSVDAAKAFTQSALRRITKDASMEGLSEGAADAASKFIDELTYGDDYSARQYLTDFLDNAIVGAAMGGGVSSIGALNSGSTLERAAAAEALKSQETEQVEKEAAAKINAAEAQKQKIKEDTAEDQTLSEKEREMSLLNDVLDQEIAEQQQKVAEAKKKDLDRLNDMTEEEITKYAKAKDRSRAAKKAASKETDSDKKAILENTASIADQQAQDVLDSMQLHEEAIAEQEAVESEANQEIAKQEEIIAKEQKLEEPKNEKIEAAQEEIAVQEAKKSEAAAKVEEIRPGYDHNLKRTRKKRRSYDEVVQQHNQETQPAKKSKYYAEALESVVYETPKGKKVTVREIADRAASNAYGQLTDYATGAGSLYGKALTREDVKKYVDDEVQKAINEGKQPYTRDLVRRAKRKVLSEYADKGNLKKPRKPRKKSEMKKYQRDLKVYETAKAQEEAIKGETQGLQDQITKLEREMADVRTPRAKKRKLQGEIDALSDQLRHGRATVGTAVTTSLDEAVGTEEGATLADFVKTEEAAEAEAPKQTQEVAKAAKMTEGQEQSVQAAVNEAINDGAVDVSSEGAINEVGSNEAVASQVDEIIKPYTKDKKSMMANPDTILQLLPQSFKDARDIESAQDLDDFMSGSNQSRAVGQVREAVKAGMLESFLDQSVQDGNGIDMTEYMESTKVDNKAGVQAMVMHLNRMYPNIKFFISKARIAEKLIEGGIDPGKADSIGGMLTPGGEIIMNPDLVTMETPIHELGHVWAKSVREMNPKLYNRGIELIKKTAEYQELVMKSKDPNSVYYNYGRVRLEEEAMATLIGVHGDMKFSDAQTANEARSLIQEIMDWISEQIGFTVTKETTLHDFLDHAVNEIVAGKAANPSQVLVSEFSELFNTHVRGEQDIDRVLSGNTLPTHKAVVNGRSVTFRAKQGDAAKIAKLLGGGLEFAEVADSQLERLKKELARIERVPQRLGDRTAEIIRRRIKQLERQSLPQATKLADMMMLNPVLKNKIRAAKPVDQKRYRTVNNDLQARKTVAAVMKVMSALPAAGRIEFANQLQRGIQSNTLAGNENVAGFQNSIIAKEILTEAGIDFEGIDMSSNLLSGVAQAMNKNNIRGVFGEKVEWGKVDYKGGDAKVTAANKGAIKAFFQALGGLNKLGQIDGQTINKIQNIWGAAGQHSLYRGATGEPKFFHKGAKLGTKKAQKGYVREHVLPASEFFDRAFNAARQGKLDSELGKLLDNYQLVLLSEADDARVNGAGFKSRQPDVFGELSDQKLGELPASYMRYFNGQVAINPTDYVDANGRTMASYMGISPEAQQNLQSSGIEGIEFSESREVNEDTAKNAEANKKQAQAIKKNIRKKLKDRYVYKTQGDFKQSKIDKKTRDILDATLKHFDQVSDALTQDQLESLSNKIDETVEEGKSTIKAKRSNAQKAKEQRQSEVNELIQETGGVDPNNMTSNQIAQMNAAKKKWFARFPRTLGDLLSPASNNDFYGLLYNLYPKGPKRAAAKKFVNEQLIRPLEEAGVKYISLKQVMKDKMLTLKKNTGMDNKTLMKEIEGLSIPGVDNITVDQAIRLYNYIKDPKLHKQLKNTGVDAAKMIEIVEAVNGNPQYKAYAEGLPGIYAVAAGALNAKLDQHGRETFNNVKIDKNKLSEEELEVLDAAFEGKIPEFAPYTPLTAEGTDSDTSFESLTRDGNFNMYTVMDGRLKRRSGGGDINILRTTTDGDFASYLEGPVHTFAYLDFARNASNIFGPKQIKAMEAAYGPEWTAAMKDSLRRIVTGKAQSGYQPEAIREFHKWINRTVGGVMFFNVKSAILQQISTFNFAADDPRAVLNGWKSKHKKEVTNFLKNSAWVKQRGEGRTEVAMDEIFSSRDQNWIDTMLEKGYSLTKMGDRNAITMGGASYMAGKFDQYLKDGLSRQEAMSEAYKDFIRLAEETQQSTRQERLGHQQTTGVGKLLLAFANTQQQYNRKMSKAVKDIAAGDNVVKNLKTIAYYGGIQNIMFTSAQKLLFAGVGLNEKDEDENSATWINALVDTILRGIGVWGGIAAAAKNAIIAASAERGADKKVMEAMVNAAPAVGTKIRNIQNALGARPVYAQSEWAEDNEETALMAYRAAAAANAVANVPLDRAVKLFEQIADLFATDLDMMQSLARAGGWSRYDLGEPAGSSPLNNIIEKEDSDPEVLGRANKDGSIEINPNLSPAQRKQVLEHEGQHAKDMKSGKLDYTDNYVKWNGKKYDRKGGKIYHNGKWVVEGDKSLPWEKVADAAESPLKASRGARKAAQNEQTKAAHAQARADRSAEWDRQRAEENVGWGDVAMKAAGAIPAAGALAGAGRVGKLVQKVGSKVGAGTKYLGYADQAVEQLFGEGADGSSVGGTTKAKAKKKAAELLAKGIVKDAAEAARIAAKSLGIVGIGMAAYDAAQLANQKMRQDMTDEEYANFKRTGSTTGSRRGANSRGRRSPATYTDKPKPGTPEWDRYVQEGVQFNKDWYNEPGTRAMLEEQAPRFQGKVDKYLDRMGEVHFDHADHLQPGEVAEYWRNNFADEAAGEHQFNVGIGPDHSVDRPGLVEHELTHAAGWDYDLGKKVLEETGGPDTSTSYGRYLSSPDEAYANLQELRKILGLSPDQRSLTPEELEKLQEEKGNSDTKAYIKAFGLDNVVKAHNKVADTQFNLMIDDKLNKLDQGQWS